MILLFVLSNWAETRWCYSLRWRLGRREFGVWSEKATSHIDYIKLLISVIHPSRDVKWVLRYLHQAGVQRRGLERTRNLEVTSKYKDT